ncbi:MAG TPA: ScyD/ScyE family protein [Hanamia sp.]|nr:ScyD/ScyE family protein [Hanamia sp.]
MKTKYIFQFSAIIISTLLFTSCKKNGVHFCNGNDKITATSEVFATGLNNPRGLKFGPNNQLYVAEGGIGGKTTTKCTQVVAPVGPYTGSTNGSRISRINPSGKRFTYVDDLPSSMTSAAQGSLISGVADVAFVGQTLYAVFGGAGCSHGVVGIPNEVIRVNPNKSWDMVANLSNYLMNHPVANPEEDDFEPDGTWYSMINVNGDLYAVEPNHGELDRISTNGKITRIIDVSATEGHIVPTAVAFNNGNFYLGNLSTFPAMTMSKVYKINMSGQIVDSVGGFNAILGLAFDESGAMYVLENFTNNPFPTPGTGDIVRVDQWGNKQVIISGLNLPTGMTFGPDGKLYVSEWGFGMPPGGGRILQITLSCDQIHGKMQN